MGLFSSISRFVEKIAGTAGGLISTVASAITPLARIAAPIIGQAIQARAGGGLLAQRGASAVGAAALLDRRPPLGVMGAQSPFANPIARAQFFPPFNPATIPARPLQGQNAQLQALLAQLFQSQQTTSFNQGAFGQSVGPSFRPFAPSFRSGQFGQSGQFRPGISRGLAPQFPQQFQQQFQPQFQQQFQPQFQQQFQPQFQPQFFQPRVPQFGGFGGFGGGGFGGGGFFNSGGGFRGF